MEQRNDTAQLLELMARPAFCVSGGCVTQVNSQAAAYNIAPGTDISRLLLTGAEEYAAFDGGCLHLMLELGGERLGASVSRLAEFDVFCLEELADSRELQAMALAARELRDPLTTVMVTAQRLYPVEGRQDDPATREQVARLNRGLFQIQRVIGNMSDAGHYAVSPSRQETVNVVKLLDEVFAKAAALTEHTGIRLDYQTHPDAVYTLADRESLERAVLNMVSNAVKFASAGSVVRAKLTRRGQKLYLTMENSGTSLSTGIPGDVFTRYQRQCGMEDSRFGIGLGLVLIRAAAAAHGGTVLMESRDGATRITMSLAIRQGNARMRDGQLHVDYAGEMDHSLIELSDILPTSLYEKEF